MYPVAIDVKPSIAEQRQRNGIRGRCKTLSAEMVLISFLEEGGWSVARFRG